MSVIFLKTMIYLQCFYLCYEINRSEYLIEYNLNGEYL